MKGLFRDILDEQERRHVEFVLSSFPCYREPKWTVEKVMEALKSTRDDQDQ